MSNRFVFLIPAFNCERKIDKTIRSVVMQTYENWKIVLVDDMSTDNTFGMSHELLNKYHVPKNKYDLIKRETKYGEVLNTLDVCGRHEENDIIVRLDAGDWITDMGALEIINYMYQAHDPAVLWTNQRWGFSEFSICGAIDQKESVYKQPWRSSHLKTFRNSSLSGINENNFKDDDGNWIMIACDQAIFLPMMERARLQNKKLLYLPLVMYHYDIDLNDQNLFKCDRSVNQKMSAERIRERGFIE